MQGHIKYATTQQIIIATSIPIAAPFIAARASPDVSSSKVLNIGSNDVKNFI